MESVNNNNIEEADWKYFPNIYQLSQYLLQSDLIQLSLTCSQFRNKLNSAIFRKLELIKDGELIPGKPNKPSKKKQLGILIEILEEDYLDKYHLVKHCILWRPCNNAFNIKIFSMFACVNKLELYSDITNFRNVASNTGTGSSLTNILKPLNKLEFLIIDCKLIDFSETNTISEFKLPICLKVLKVTGDSSNSLNLNPIENIGEEHVNLKEATIINNSMLDNMTVLMSSLTEVDLFNNQYFSTELLSQFFSLNPQLKKISISLKYIQFNVINSILQLKNLDHLYISNSNDKNTKELKNLVINTSIKHLNIGCNITQNILIPTLSSLASLQTLEFSEYDFHNFSSLDWSSYTRKIPLLHLNGIWNAKSNVDEFVNPAIFDRIKFSNMFELDYYLMYYWFDELDNWKVVQDDLSDSREFWLVKKGEDEVGN
jgi:hypothetical protein